MRFLLLLFALVASGMTASKAAQAEEIIGFIGAYTGPRGSAENQQIDDNLKVTVSQINRGGGVLGKQLKLIPRDSQGDPRVAHASAVELVLVERAQLILMHCDRYCAVAVSTKLQEYKVSSAVVLIGTPNPADEATKLLEAWVERVKAAGNFNLSSRNIGKQASTVARSGADRDLDQR